MALAYNPAENEKPERAPRKPFQFAPHKPDCTCGRCDLTPIQCPVYEGGERCTFEGRGRRALGAHVVFIHKRRRRKMTAVLAPDGLGFLRKALFDPKRIYGFDLSALPRFSRSLAQSRQLGEHTRRRSRRSRAAVRYLLERATANLDGFVQMPAWNAPGKLIEPVAQLARVADVEVGTVVDALLAYGLEKLSHELRLHRTAPEPFIPDPAAERSTLPQSAAPTPSSTLFPKG